MEQRDIFLAGIVSISYLMISFSISFPVAFLHISHLKPASKRPLFRSGYSECVLDGGVDRDMFFPCSAGHCVSQCLQILLKIE